MSLIITISDEDLPAAQALLDDLKAKNDAMEIAHPSLKMTALHVSEVRLANFMEDHAVLNGTQAVRGAFYGSNAFLLNPQSGGGPKGL